MVSDGECGTANRHGPGRRWTVKLTGLGKLTTRLKLQVIAPKREMPALQPRNVNLARKTSWPFLRMRRSKCVR